MKVCVCDICQATEKLAVGGLFNLKLNEFDIDICGACAVNVVAATMNDLPEQVVAAVRRLSKLPIPTKEPVKPSPRPVKAIDEKDLEQFIAQNTAAMNNKQNSEKERIDFLTEKYGQTVFIEQFGEPQRIGSSVKLGMPGRKAARKVEILEPVEGRPDCYFVFQIKD